LQDFNHWIACVFSAWMWTSARAEEPAARARFASTNSEDTGASVLRVQKSMPGQANAETWTSAPAALVVGTPCVPTCLAASGVPVHLASRVILMKLVLVSFPF
jgi:hypothetical protein